MLVLLLTKSLIDELIAANEKLRSLNIRVKKFNVEGKFSALNGTHKNITRRNVIILLCRSLIFAER